MKPYIEVGYTYICDVDYYVLQRDDLIYHQMKNLEVTIKEHSNDSMIREAILKILNTKHCFSVIIAEIVSVLMQKNIDNRKKK